ncbi:MAG: hypothetical protein ABIR65_01210 [Pseudolysinimonas sp.]
MSKLKVRTTNRFASRTEPTFTGPRRQMSASEVVEEMADLRRGGTFVALEAVDETGRTVTEDEIEEMARDAAHGD